MGKTTISWTATVLEDGTVLPGFTWNPWIGCTKVSQGCKFCYAERVGKKAAGRMLDGRIHDEFPQGAQ